MKRNGSIAIGELGPLDDEESLCDSGIEAIDSLTAQALVAIQASSACSIVEHVDGREFDGTYGLLWRNVMTHATGRFRFDWAIVTMPSQLSEMLAIIASEPLELELETGDEDTRAAGLN